MRMSDLFDGDPDRYRFLVRRYRTRSVAVGTDFKRLKEVIRDHHRGNYEHRKDCRVCWLIAEVLALNDELNRAIQAIKDERACR